MVNEEVEKCTVFLTLAGSKAYGTSLPTSDTDIRGVCIPQDKSYYLGMGLKKFEQKEGGWEDDRVIYDFRKSLSLMADGNPNMVDLLFAEDKSILKIEPEWEEVRNNKKKFLSKKMRYTYGGYAFAQLKRIQRHRSYLLAPPKKKPERSEFGLPQEKIVQNEDIGAFQWLLVSFMKDSIQMMNFSDSTRDELERHLNVIGLVQGAMAEDMSSETWKKMQQVTGVSDALMETMNKEKAYANAMSDWTAYQNWDKTRNDKRRVLEQQFGYDTKHAMHLVRLMRMGIEILEKEEVLVFRSDADELLAIRNGAWSYDKIVEYAYQCEKRMDELLKTTKLPSNPDRHFIDKMCQNVIEKYLNRIHK